MAAFTAFIFLIYIAFVRLKIVFDEIQHQRNQVVIQVYQTKGT